MIQRTMMMILTTLMLISGGVDGWGQDTWKKTYGGSNSEEVNSMSITQEGDILITGYTDSNDGDFKDMNMGGQDIFIIKLDKGGNVLWKKTLGGTNDDVGLSITSTSDGEIVITGYTKSSDVDFEGMNKGKEDIFVIKLDRYGELVWKKTFGGTENENGNSITMSADNGILVTGYTYSNNGDFGQLNKGDQDIFVIKLDKDGNVLWNKTIGGTGYEGSKSITTKSDGGILITGWTNSNSGDFNGLGKDGYPGTSDIFVIRMDKNGRVLWKNVIGGKTSDVGTSISTTPDNKVFITGSSESIDGDFEGMRKGGMDIIVIKIDDDGRILWKKMFGGPSDESGETIIANTDGGVLISGFSGSYDGDFKGMNKGRLDIFMIKLDAKGNVIRKNNYGGLHNDCGSSIKSTSDQRIMITGYTLSNTDNFERESKKDIFIMKLDRNGFLTPPKNK